MLIQEFRPTVRDLVKLDDLPDSLGFLEDSLGNILDKIFYDNLISNKSVSGDFGYYNLDLILKREIKLLSIPGTEIALVLNPPDEVGTQSGSVFNVSFEYQWEILKYIRNAKLSTFSFDVRGFVDLISNIFGITTQDMTREAINVFIGDLDNPPSGEDPLQAFVDLFNSVYTPAISYSPTGDIVQDVQDIISQIEAGGNDVLSVIIENYLEDTFDRLKLLLNKWVGPLDEERLKQLVIPSFGAAINGISFGLTLPRSVFIPLDEDEDDEPYPEPIQSMIRVNAGSLYFDTRQGLTFDDDVSFSFTKSEIMNSGFTIMINELKIDLSETSNIPEATADGRPMDFKGVYINTATIGFPAFWNHDDGASTGELTVSQMIAGTGGLSGLISLTAVSAGDPVPLIKACFGNGFCVSLDSFSLEFQQNTLLESDIKGTMVIPGFKDANGVDDASINIAINIGQDGDFSVTASESDGVRISIPNILDFIINSASVGREDDRFFLAVSGSLEFMDQGGVIGQILPDKIDIQKLIIWDDGKIELEGGKITLPKAISLKIGPVELSVSAIGLGSHEQEHNGVMREYRYFVFDGSVGVDPGGVEVSGNGVAFYFTVDGGTLHVFLRIQSIAIDLLIPGDADPETAALILSGFLSMKTPEGGGSGTEYAGGIDFSLPKIKLGGSAAMRLNPKIPAFLVDVGLELSAPILLGSTGLGIYGFRGLIGKDYVATKGSVGLTDDDPWWQYYKAKIPDSYKEGITTDKFEQTPGFSIGAGVSLATAPDGGQAFSSKIFFLLSLPEVFLLQGQAQLLKGRIGLDATEDPPFYAIIAITSSSVEAGFGVNLKVPDDGPSPGAIATVDALIEMGFFFGDAGAWYINIGKDQPEDRRIQVRLFTLFNAYFYMMFSSSGIRGGAGASYELNKKFGPLKAELYAYLDTAGKFAFKPKQIGASIQIGGGVGLYIFGFGFSINVNAALAAEAPKPFMVTGSLEACIRVLRKDRCAKFDFTWTFENNLDTSEIPLLKDNLSDSGKAVNIQTQQTYELYASSSQPSASQVDDYIIPADCIIDIEFLKGVLPSSSVRDKFGGNTQGSNHIDYVAPQRGKSDQVRHEYSIDRVVIKYHDGSGWVDYDVYEAATPLQVADFVTTDLATLPYGYWQYQSPDLHNKLRILGQSPIEYTSQGSGGLILEDLHITSESIFCEPASISKFCIHFEDLDPGYGYFYNRPLLPDGKSFFHKKALFKVIGSDGVVMDRPQDNHTHAIGIGGNSDLQIDFIEPSACVVLRVTPICNVSTVTFYEKRLLPTTNPSGQPLYEYVAVDSSVFAKNFPGTAAYDDINKPIHRVVISSGSCDSSEQGEGFLQCDKKPKEEAEYLLNYFNKLLETRAFTNQDFVYLPLEKQPDFNGVLMNTPLIKEKLEKDSYLWHTITEQNENKLCWHIMLVEEVLCKICLEIKDSKGSINWSSIVAFENLRPDPEMLQPGSNHNFLVDAVLENGEVVTLSGKSCHNLMSCKWQLNPPKCGMECLELEQALAVEKFISTICRSHQLINEAFQIWPKNEELYKGIFFDSILYGEAREGNPIIYKLLSQSKTHWEFEVIDEAGFNCTFSINTISNQTIGNWKEVIGISDLKADPAYETNGENYHFIAWLILSNGERVRVTGTSCYPVAYCQPACATYLYELCLQTYEEAVYNENLPTQSEVDDEVNTMLDAMSGSIRPIWRFDTRFMIEVETTDKLYRDSGSSVLATYSNTSYYGFRTVGPIGHFHQYQDDGNSLQTQSDYAALLAEDKEDEYKMARLLHYIDFSKSYPNADGQLVNAKPLFYKSPKLSVFYLQPYVYEFFRDWDDYNGTLTELNAELEVLIKDPAPDPSEVVPDPTPAAWVINPYPIVMADLQILNNMIENSTPTECPPDDPISPLDVNSEFEPEEDLKPLKLYTGIFNAKFKRATDTDYISREVHRYGFQTSRYADFEEQVQSYLMKESDDPGAATREAVFVIEKEFDDATQILVAQSILDPADTMSREDPLRQQFGHPFNRLMEGALQMEAIHPPIGTEFNLIRDTATDRLIGILIKNPEPFNDPKIPLSEIADTILMSAGGSSTNEYMGLFSKDYSQVFITNSDLSMDIPAGVVLDFEFEFRLYDGSQYQTEATESIQVDLSQYS